jgi:HPt (histidine-containing phosphotransfer) domain-containing protein
MDDHLPKPYTRKQLAAMLTRWLPAHCIEELNVGAVAPALDAGSAQTHDPVLDPAALENIRAVDGEGVVLAEVIQLYLDEAPGQLRLLRSALEAGRLGDLGRSAHALKSASLNVGAKALCETCSRLERQAKAGESAGTAELVAGIETLMDPVRRALLVELNNLPPRRAASTDPSAALNGELA